MYKHIFKQRFNRIKRMFQDSLGNTLTHSLSNDYHSYKIGFIFSNEEDVVEFRMDFEMDIENKEIKHEWFYSKIPLEWSDPQIDWEKNNDVPIVSTEWLNTKYNFCHTQDAINYMTTELVKEAHKLYYVIRRSYCKQIPLPHESQDLLDVENKYFEQIITDLMNVEKNDVLDYFNDVEVIVENYK